MKETAIDSKEEEEPSLPKLLSALALGVRAVNAIPLSNKPNRGNNDDDDDEKEDEDEDGSDDDDEFAYNMAFPEYASLCNESRTILSKLLSEAIHAASSTDAAIMEEEDDGDDDEGIIDYYNFDDPTLWEKCADACEALLEHVEVYVQDAQEVRLGGGDSALDVLENAAKKARERAKGGYERLLSGLVEMEKPQITYNFHSTIDNSRTEPFKPSVHPQKPYSVSPLSECLDHPIQGHGLETRHGSISTTKYPDDMVAPPIHYSHPYQTEIEEFEYREWQLQVSRKDELMNGRGGLGGTLLKDEEGGEKTEISSLNAVWIDTVDDLQALSHRIETENVREIALDLEAHSHRTFGGFVCLMQLSLRRTKNDGGHTSGATNTIETSSDFLIDTLALRSSINQYLAPVFANPDIVKVMHGADSDIPWLQRDFGLYIVNLFDTGRASRMLKFPSAGLAYLLSKYAGIIADKKHQLSDWRQRPLPEDMKAYATSDTLYLLDIYDRLKLELDTNSNVDVSVESVLDTSRKICLIRYDKEAFCPSGYQSLMKWKKRSKATTSFSTKQENALKALYDWRDKVAREEDESVQYTCPNSALLRIATARPHNVITLQGLVNPLPPLVLRHSQEVLNVIKHSSSMANENNDIADTKTSTKDVTSSEEKISQLRASASPFAFRPASSNSCTAPSPVPHPLGDGRPALSGPSGVLSPVLGTEALYKQAGWMTPQGGGGAVSSSFSASINPHMISMDEENATASTDEDDDMNHNDSSNNKKEVYASKRAVHTLDVSKANQHFISTEYTSHSIELKSLPNDDGMNNTKTSENTGKYRGRSVDGLGAAREAFSQGHDSTTGKNIEGNGNTTSSTAEEECKAARESALKILEVMSKNDIILLGLVRPQNANEFGESLDKEGDVDNTDENDLEEDVVEKDEEEDDIPKSMREIYKISNRNRRKPKKNTSNSNNADKNKLEDSKMPEQMDVDSIEGANALLASRGSNGKGYFDDSKTSSGTNTNDGNNGTTGGKSKRQRTKQGGGGNKDDSGANSVRDANIALMQEVGWVKDKEDAESLVVQQRTEGGDNSQVNNNAPSETRKRDNEGHQASRASPSASSYDYSNVGSIAAYNPKATPSANPFFAGAAVTGGVLTQGGSSGKKGGKKGKGNRASPANSGGGNTERPGKRADSQSFIYRTGNKR